MNFDSGELICPKCGNKGVSKFKKWMSKESYVYNDLKKTWILYDEANNECTCCSLCPNPECARASDSILRCKYCKKCNGVCCEILFFPCLSIFYLIFCSPLDLIKCLCCKKRKYVSISFEDIEAKNEEDLWNHLEGLTEENLNIQYQWICPTCKYWPKTFLEFIPKSTDVINISNEQTNRILLINNHIPKKIPENISKEENIAIRFTSVDQTINFCTACRPSEIFRNIVKKLYEEYPEYNKKKHYFLSNGGTIDCEKSLEKNRIKNNAQIMLILQEEDD